MGDDLYDDQTQLDEELRRCGLYLTAVAIDFPHPVWTVGEANLPEDDLLATKLNSLAIDSLATNPLATNPLATLTDKGPGHVGGGPGCVLRARWDAGDNRVWVSARITPPDKFADLQGRNGAALFARLTAKPKRAGNKPKEHANNI